MIEPVFERVGVLGAGAWGAALAQVAARGGRDVVLWCRRRAQAVGISARRENADYLPGVLLESSIRATSALEDLAPCEVILVVTPAQHTRAALEALARHAAPRTPVVMCAKGIEQGTLQLMVEVLAEAMPQARPAVLSGPTFAREVAQGLPAAVTLACADPALGRQLAAALGRPEFRPYLTDDLYGAEVGGAVKNVLAIACGIVAGRRLGQSAHASLVTRGFAEMLRLGEALGGRTETMLGPCGLGDLVLTCSSLESRNMSLGHALGQGRRLAHVLAERRGVTEGVATAPALIALARRAGVEMPIAEAVDAVLAERLSIDAAIEGLLSRPIRFASP